MQILFGVYAFHFFSTKFINLFQVAKLFQNDEDLLREFGQFLPDAGGAVGATMTASAAAASAAPSHVSVLLESENKDL